MQLLASLLDLLAPRQCVACGAVGTEPWCADCPAPDPWEPALLPHSELPLHAGGLYGGSLAEAIRRFKYDPKPELAPPLARWLASRLEPLGRVTGVWVPVPLHPKRLAERGFNQSALLARQLARQLGGSVAPRLLVRTRDTAQQARLGHAEREQNLEAAFIARPERVLPGPLLLVDDVVTSGSTVRACLRALQALDLQVSAVVALARTLDSADPS